MIIHLTRTNDIVDGLFRPIASNLTTEGAGSFLRDRDAALPLYVEAQFRVEPLAPVSVEKQYAAKLRRLRAIANAAGRVIARVDERPGFPHQYTALLAR